MRVTVLIAILVLAIGSANAASKRHSHPYRDEWKRSMVGKQALIGVGAGAGISHARGSHRELGGGVAGFGKRLGLGYGTHAVKSTVEHAVAAPLHEDLHYHRSNKKGFGPRLKHALLSTVITRNTRNGKKRPAAGRISGNAAAGAFTQAVLPAASGAATAGIGLAGTAGANVAREFWPQGKKKSHHHRRG